MSSEFARKMLKNFAEDDPDIEGGIIFKGIAVELIEAINELDDAEMKLHRLLHKAVLGKYNE